MATAERAMTDNDVQCFFLVVVNIQAFLIVVV